MLHVEPEWVLGERADGRRRRRRSATCCPASAPRACARSARPASSATRRARPLTRARPCWPTSRSVWSRRGGLGRRRDGSPQGADSTRRNGARGMTPRPLPRPPDGRLPAGFAVRLDPRTRRREDGAVLLGGSPLRQLRLTPRAAGFLTGDRLVVRDDPTATLAGRLLDAGVAHPDLPGPADARDVTVVVPGARPPGRAGPVADRRPGGPDDADGAAGRRRRRLGGRRDRRPPGRRARRPARPPRRRPRARRGPQRGSRPGRHRARRLPRLRLRPPRRLAVAARPAPRRSPPRRRRPADHRPVGHCDRPVRRLRRRGRRPRHGPAPGCRSVRARPSRTCPARHCSPGGRRWAPDSTSRCGWPRTSTSSGG